MKRHTEHVLVLVAVAVVVAIGLGTFVYSGIYNIGIGSGALIGAKVSTHAGIQYVGVAGSIIGMMAILLYFVIKKPHLQGRI